MSLQKLFQRKELQSQFEHKARIAGYSNFNRRAGSWYCDSNLNLLAEGFLMAREDVIVFTDGEAEAVQTRVDVELSPGFERGLAAINNHQTNVEVSELSA
jgi:hypothetical protein